MKKKMKFGSFMLLLLVVLVSLVACGETSVESALPSGYEVVTNDKFGNATVRTVKNIQTNCFYSLAVRVNGGVSIVQNFVEKNGVSVPDCE